MTETSTTGQMICTNCDTDITRGTRRYQDAGLALTKGPAEFGTGDAVMERYCRKCHHWQAEACPDFQN